MEMELPFRWLILRRTDFCSRSAAQKFPRPVSAGSFDLDGEGGSLTIRVLGTCAQFVFRQQVCLGTDFRAGKLVGGLDVVLFNGTRDVMSGEACSDGSCGRFLSMSTTVLYSESIREVPKPYSIIHTRKQLGCPIRPHRLRSSFETRQP